MKIFVLGRSGVGKTPFAKKVSEAAGWPLISASEWVKTIFRNTFDDRAEYVRAITTFSIQELQKRPSRCVDFIKSKYDLMKSCVIEGIRNPHDFVHLYNPATDIVVLLDWTENGLKETEFERWGLGAIRSYLRFLSETGILGQEAPVHEFTFNRFFEASSHSQPSGNSLEQVIQTFITERLPKEERPTATNLSFVHAEIRPLRVRIRKEFLFDMDNQYAGQYETGTLFAVSSYPDSVPTFKVMTENGSVFSYLPPHAFVAEGADPSFATLELGDLAYHNCRLPEICVSYFDFLVGPLWAYFKKRNLWLKGSYLFTVDWYTGNDLMHFVSLENGQYAFLPQHKIKFGNSDKSFPPYKKLHQEWSVEE